MINKLELNKETNSLQKMTFLYVFTTPFLTGKKNYRFLLYIQKYLNLNFLTFLHLKKYSLILKCEKNWSGEKWGENRCFLAWGKFFKLIHLKFSKYKNKAKLFYTVKIGRETSNNFFGNIFLKCKEKLFFCSDHNNLIQFHFNIFRLVEFLNFHRNVTFSFIFINKSRYACINNIDGFDYQPSGKKFTNFTTLEGQKTLNFFFRSYNILNAHDIGFRVLTVNNVV